MQVGIQLYTVRSLTADDMVGALEKLSAAGYSTVELAGYGSSNPEAIRATLDQLGMSAVSAHVALARIENEFETVLSEMTMLGCRHLIVPWLMPELRNTAGYERLIAALNERGSESRDAGLRLGYHNHDFEFEPVDGVLPFELIAESTDPELVSLEIDVGWVAYAGGDPVELIERYAGRVPLLHAKEEQTDDGRPLPAPGAGSLPWGAIIAAGKRAGSEYLIVEDDNPVNPLATAKAGLENLNRLIG